VTERVTHTLRFPADAVEVDEDLCCLTIRVTDDQLRRMIGVLEAMLAGLEPVTAVVMGREG
jgi:hypothetical protein